MMKSQKKSLKVIKNHKKVLKIRWRLDKKLSKADQKCEKSSKKVSEQLRNFKRRTIWDNFEIWVWTLRSYKR